MVEHTRGFLFQEVEEADELRQLEESVEVHPENPSLHFRLGLLLWKEGIQSGEIKERAAEQFIISAKLDPHNADPFKYLGHYYAVVVSDSQRAIKCYRRAVTLNPDDSDAGEALCDLLDQAGKESLEIALCTDASDKSPRAFWAFRRLGYIHLHHNRLSEAVQCLNQAIKGYPECADLWEALGVAYERLGMLTAAGKSFGRTMELEDTHIFSLIESGNIYLALGSFRKAVELFQQSLKILPDNLSANYGLASGLLSLSKEWLSMGAHRMAASLLEDACKVANNATKLAGAGAGHTSCVWKLLGDIQVTYARCLPWRINEVDGLQYDAESFSASVQSWKQTRLRSVTSAARSYQHALHLAPWQAGLYVDIATTLDLVSFYDETNKLGPNTWDLPEKVALGALLLESDNSEFWMALGCLSGHNALKQHALIRALQLDFSSAVAWGHIGKLYATMGEKKLAGQAFDCARSIDPSLLVPWAGMSAGFGSREVMPDAAFECCLRAVQIFPHAEFQIGLAKLAILSQKLTSTQVFTAVQQAVHQVPQYPESHNLNGIIYEARLDYPAAVSCYKLARCAVSVSPASCSTSVMMQDVEINLARSLCKAGFAADAVQECERLIERGLGMHEAEVLNIYALCLWKLGKNDLAVAAVSHLAASLCSMEHKFAVASLSLICKLSYHISGSDSAISTLLNMPQGLLLHSKIIFVVYSISALDRNDRLDPSFLDVDHSSLPEEDSIQMHCLIANAKMVKHGSKSSLGFLAGIDHLKNALRIFPNSCSLRSLLGQILLSSKGWADAHFACHCCPKDASYSAAMGGSRSEREILGAAAVACHAVGETCPAISIPTCGCQSHNRSHVTKELQKYWRQEPWNLHALYLLILNLFHKARRERFPQGICLVIERLVSLALARESGSDRSMLTQYRKYVLLLCASEISLQSGRQGDCIRLACVASSLLLPDAYLFFGHLIQCRAHAAAADRLKLEEERRRCLELKTDHPIGWLGLQILELQNGMSTDLKTFELRLLTCSGEVASLNIWMAMSCLASGLAYLRNREYIIAEKLVGEACSLAVDESCIFLCHGVTCLLLAKQFYSSQFLTRAIKSLIRADAIATTRLPFLSLLLAQAYGCFGSIDLWEKYILLEWNTWKPERRPAEVLFLMHVLAKRSKTRAGLSSDMPLCGSPIKLVLQAIHKNPSCLRYWKALRKLVELNDNNEFNYKSCSSLPPQF